MASERWGALPLGELSPDDELELRVLVGKAWERRYKPDFRECIADIVDWWDERYQRLLERRERSRLHVLQTLRSCK